jgi:CBS-domain-containing membrane protein
MRARSKLGADDDLVAEDVMDPGLVTFRPDITVDETAERMRHDELPTAPITTSEGRLIGVAVRRVQFATFRPVLNFRISGMPARATIGRY